MSSETLPRTYENGRRTGIANYKNYKWEVIMFNKNTNEFIQG